MIKENHIIINKTARYFTLGELNEKTRHVWIVLHGFGYHAKTFLESFAALADEKTFFIAPEGLNRFYLKGFTGKVGATWMTTEDRLNEIKDYINYLNDLYENFELDRFNGTITALGFSQGASTLSRWLNVSEHRINNAIIYAGEVAPDVLPLSAHSGLRKTKNYFVFGTRDEYFSNQRIAQMKTAYTEMNFTEVVFEGTHEVKPDVIKGLGL